MVYPALIEWPSDEGGGLARRDDGSTEGLKLVRGLSSYRGLVSDEVSYKDYCVDSVV